jgi:GNAT superfamily N-acetyltransferase
VKFDIFDSFNRYQDRRHIQLKFVKLDFDNPYITIIKENLWKEWGKPNNRPFMDKLLDSTLGDLLVPSTWACIVDNALAGSVSLFVNDLKSRQDLSPWVACLYVQPDYRNQGIGKTLLNLSEDVAKKAGYSSVYLFTHLKDYYENAGWIFEGIEMNYLGEEVRLYKKKLLT